MDHYARAIVRVFQEFKWTKVAFLTQKENIFERVRYTVMYYCYDHCKHAHRDSIASFPGSPPKRYENRLGGEPGNEARDSIHPAIISVFIKGILCTYYM